MCLCSNWSSLTKIQAFFFFCWLLNYCLFSLELTISSTQNSLGNMKENSLTIAFKTRGAWKMGQGGSSMAVLVYEIQYRSPKLWTHFVVTMFSIVLNYRQWAQILYQLNYTMTSHMTRSGCWAGATWRRHHQLYRYHDMRAKEVTTFKPLGISEMSMAV